MFKGGVNYIYFGTPEFSAIILKNMVENGYSPTLVICNPDKPFGRKKIITPPPVKVVSLNYNLKIWQPEKLIPADFMHYVGNEKFGLLAAYGKIVPKEIINFFPKGIIGVHPSLLPKYRGPTPIQNAILNGDKKTGVTLFLLDEFVDHGPILSQAEIEIEDEVDYEKLQKKLAELSAKLILDNLEKFLSGSIRPLAQNEELATYTVKFKTEDGFIPEKELDEAISRGGVLAESIFRRIRALNPEPGTWSFYKGKRTKLLKAELIDGRLKLQKIQYAGKKPIELS